MDRLQNASKVADGATITNSYSYENDKLKTITHNGFNYGFDYDSLGNNTTVSVGTQNLITNTYEGRTSKLLESKYGNNQKVSSVYDNEDRVISESYTDNSNTTHERYKYSYDASGNVGYHEDIVNKINYRYIYDLSDRLAKIKDSNGNTVSYNYDKNNNNSKIEEKINNSTYTTSYGYDKDDRPTSITTPKGKNINHNYDGIGRVSSSTINTGIIPFSTKYSYINGVNRSTTNKVASIENRGNKTSYTYDKNGNIKTINENSKTIKYYYNELKKEETRNSEVTLEKTIKYS
jgi:YD repeat-containing protein